MSGVRHEYSLPEVGSGEVGEYSCSLMRSGSTVAHATVEITVICESAVIVLFRLIYT